MWYQTKITELLGIKYPILSGPMGGGLSSTDLVALVSNAGGLGGYGAYTLSPEQLQEVGKELKTKTDKPFNINLWVNDTDQSLKSYTPEQFDKVKTLFKPYFDELGVQMPEISIDIPSKFEKQVEVLFDIRPAVFSFVFGIPSKEILDECRKLKIKTVGAATTIEEALALEAAGVDAIAAAGFEAGGHRPSFLKPAQDSLYGTFSLIQLLAQKVKTPLIAAGGIADGKGIAAALTLGADAAQIGTAFLATKESNATALHREMLFSKQAEYSVLTKSFTGRLGRGISSKLAHEIPFKQDVAPFPLQSQFLSPLRAAAIAQGKQDMFTFWSGQIAPILKHTSAAELMNALISETSAILR